LRRSFLLLFDDSLRLRAFIWTEIIFAKLPPDAWNRRLFELVLDFDKLKACLYLLRVLKLEDTEIIEFQE